MKKKIVTLKVKSFKYSLLVIDGFLGSGKTLIAPIISSYQNSQNQSISYDFENVIIFNYLKKVDNKTASVFLKLITEENLFNYEIGRKLNLREFDHTGPKYNPKINEDLKKIKTDNEKKVLKKINHQNKVLNLVSHKTFLNYEILKKTYNNNFLLLICVRHPVFLFRHYFNFYKNLKSTPKDFTVNIMHKKIKLPWFYKEILNKTSSRLGDNLINLLFFLQKKIKLLKNEKKIKIINFEEFVVNPKKFLKKIEKELSLKKNQTLLTKILRDSGIPRKKINYGTTHVDYALKKTEPKNKQIYFRELKFIKKNISKKSQKLLSKLIKNYNSEWPSLFKYYE